MITTPPTEEPRLDILCVLYRELEDLARFQDCLTAQDDRRFSLTVALNDPDEAVRAAVKGVAGVDFVEGPNNGYAGGLERIWRRGTADWILIANTDLEFDASTLGRLIAVADTAADTVGLIAPKVVYGDGRLQSVAGLVLGPEGLARPRGIDEVDQGQYDNITTAPIPSGCCCLVRRAVLQDIGGLDEDFFMYVEDVDLALKALWAGWDSLAANDITIIHHHGGAAGRRSALQLYHMERNHWWVAPWLPTAWRRRLPWSMLQRWRILKSRQGELGIGGKSLAPLAIKATLAGIWGLPRMWRRASAVPRRLTEAEVMAKLEGHTCSLEEFLAS